MTKTTPTYEDLEFEISRCRHGELEVRLLRSPYDRPREPFTSPWVGEEVASLLDSIELQVLRSSEHLRDLRPASPGPAFPPDHEAQAVGERLFASLLRGGLATTFLRSRAALDSRSPRDAGGLRFRLGFGSEEASAAEAAVLPWELLRDPSKRGPRAFLALDSRTPLVRYLDAAEPAWGLTVDPPLRLLAVAPSAPVADGLDLGREQELLAEAVAGASGMIRLEPFAGPVTRAALHHRLLSGEPVHVLHFMGHGGFTDDGQGALVLEDEAGGPLRVAGAELALEIQEWVNSLRLVVLNACLGAAVERRGGCDPYSSVAAALVTAGLPAAVAMQFPISDQAALAFSHGFYQALALRRPVDAAVDEGRLAIHREAPASLEWATPVLYLRVPDGQIFSTVSSETSAPAPARLGIVSIDGWGGEIREGSDYLLDLTPRFLGRHPKEGTRWPDLAREVGRFLSASTAAQRPYRLEMAAHWSLAFAAGRALEAKAGLDLAVRQRGTGGVDDWKPDEGARGPGWKKTVQNLDPAAADLALAVSPSRSIVPAVRSYLEREGIAVRRLVGLRFAEGSSQTGVRSGAHAWSLAERVARYIEERPFTETEGRVHLFFSGPNTLAFYLGRLSKSFGRVQLYEHEPGRPRRDLYWPSFEVPWEEVA